MTETVTPRLRTAGSGWVHWETDRLSVALATGADAPVRLVWLGAVGQPVPPSLPAPAQPLVEIFAVGHGHARHNLRHTASAIGARMRLTGVAEHVEGRWQVLTVDQADPVSGLAARSVLRVARGVAAIQSWTELRNTASSPVALQAVSSFAAAFGGGLESLTSVDLVAGRSEWLAEGRFTRRAVRDTDALVELDLAAHQRQDARSRIAITSGGTWSSGERTPVGVVENRVSGTAWAWHVEHNGAWHVELAERLGRDDGELVVGLYGPTDTQHHWLLPLEPGETFHTVPVAVALGAPGWQAAVGELTEHRRALRADRGSGADAELPVIFNDYMNTLMGDPTTEALLPLIDAAATAGADYFCIDAGWYDDGGDWWDSVGEWEPSTRRFPDGGLEAVVEHIRRRGMVPGLWLEPEVVGVRSPMVDRLPHDAFLQRGGEQVVEHGRLFLDLRHPAAVAHLDDVVDRLVRDFGVGYFKLDYNVTPGPGSDRAAASPGAGLLDHNRAHLAWLDGVLARHPRLLIENCASGAQRADYAMLSRLHIQSTSDQQNPLLYPPVAAAAAMTVLPEQAGSWGYPQPGMSLEQAAFTLAAGMLGRLYLSGRLDGMTTSELALVQEAVSTHRGLLPLVARGRPVWPLDLPRWQDEWVATGLCSETETVLTVWHRGRTAASTELSVPHLTGREVTVEQIFPDPASFHGWTWAWEDEGKLRVTAATGAPSARVIRLRSRS